MKRLPWRASFELGLPAMDDTHREFVNLVNELYACPDEALPEKLRAFVAHTVAHFEQENAWMQASGFPPIGCHMGEHERVLAVCTRVLEMVDAGDVGVGRRLIEELPGWFEHHAATMDDALAYYIRITGFDVGAITRPLREAVAVG